MEIGAGNLVEWVNGGGVSDWTGASLSKMGKAGILNEHLSFKIRAFMHKNEFTLYLPPSPVIITHGVCSNGRFLILAQSTANFGTKRISWTKSNSSLQKMFVTAQLSVADTLENK